MKSSRRPEEGLGLLPYGAQPPTQVAVHFIDANRAHYVIEPVIRVLLETPGRIAVIT
jgi:hypothetical protein